jgi:hypothetical protein
MAARAAVRVEVTRQLVQVAKVARRPGDEAGDGVAHPPLTHHGGVRAGVHVEDGLARGAAARGARRPVHGEARVPAAERVRGEGKHGVPTLRLAREYSSGEVVQHRPRRDQCAGPQHDAGTTGPILEGNSKK